MIIQCGSCSRKFFVKDKDIPEEGRMVQCGYCSATWHQMLISIPTQAVKSHMNESLSVDNIGASDGKTYKFLGSQWAELLPSGKTGLFARRKIGKELDKLTGRKEKKTVQRKQKKIKEIEIDSIQKVIDPSSGSLDDEEKLSGSLEDEEKLSGSLDDEEKLSDIHKSKQGPGFFGYFFLLIIVGFSVVGVLRTFENDLLHSFPQTKYIYELLDEQLKFLSESVKNMIVIFDDLMSSY